MFKLRISKSFSFDAAHNLEGHVPEGHPCASPHGHTYTITVDLCSTIDLPDDGMVIDFGVIKGGVCALFDHKDLNQVFEQICINEERPLATTVENLALAIREVIEDLLRKRDVDDILHARIERVRVQEGHGGFAEVFSA